MIHILVGTRLSTVRVVIAVLGLVGAAGCDAAQDFVEPVGVVDEQIIDGTPVTDTRGMVMVHSGGLSCSGALITNNWVLTAKHCLPPPTPESPIFAATVTLQDGSEQTAFGGDLYLHPVEDVAAIRLPSFFDTLGGTHSLHHTPYLSDVPMDKQLIHCESYGTNTCDDSGYGTLRAADYQVVPTLPGDSTHTILPTVQGRSLWHGDSGGTCFTSGFSTLLSGPMLTGVNKSGVCGDFSRQTRTSTFRGWLDQLMFTGWGSIGGVTTLPPAIASAGSGNLHAFIRRSSSQLWLRTFDPVNLWSNWLTIPAITIGGPSAASHGPGQMAVAVVSSDNAMYIQELVNGVWPMAWTLLDKPAFPLTGTPALFSPGPGSLMVIGHGTDGFYYSRTRPTPASAWSAWTRLVQGFSDPAAISLDGVIRLFWVEPTGALNVSISTDGATWSTPTSVGSGFQGAYGPAVTSSARHRLDLFGTLLDGSVVHRRYLGGWESSWITLPGVSARSKPSVSSSNNGAMELFVRGSNDQAWINTYPRQ